MKFKSHRPSVTPSARVLVRFPVHVILRVEAAFALTIVPKPNAKMNINVKRRAIATTTEPVARLCVMIANKASNGDLIRAGVLRVMTEKETRLEQAIRQVAETKRFIAEQRQRIEQLRAAGISTVDAEQTLEVLFSSLPLLERYEKYVREHSLKNAN